MTEPTSGWWRGRVSAGVGTSGGTDINRWRKGDAPFASVARHGGVVREERVQNEERSRHGPDGVGRRRSGERAEHRREAHEREEEQNGGLDRTHAWVRTFR